jgi:ABC-type histidine transport system ATPase subunit
MVFELMALVASILGMGIFGISQSARSAMSDWLDTILEKNHEPVDQRTKEHMTMIVVTREIDFTEDIADRVLFMGGAAVAEESPLDVIFNTPFDQRTKIFLRNLPGEGER